MGRIPALDGLRGVAILLVVSLHCFNWPRGGHLGVDLFFILSGYLITGILLDERTRTGTIRLRAFYGRRARRLLPALAVMLAVYLVIAAAKGGDDIEAAAAGGLYVGNLIEAFGPQPGGPLFDSGLDHLWSLAQEEQFYVLWPLALPLVARARRPVRLLLAVIASLCVYRIALALTGATHHRLYNGPDTHMDGLLIGCAAAFLLTARPSWRIRPIWVAVAVPFAVDSLLIRTPSSGWDAFGLPVAEAALAAVFLAAVTQQTCRRLFENGVLRWFGRISYSLYLWHFMLMWAFGWQHARGLEHGTIVASLSVLIAWTSTRLMEEPIRARRWPTLTARNPAGAASAA